MFVSCDVRYDVWFEVGRDDLINGGGLLHRSNIYEWASGASNSRIEAISVNKDCLARYENPSTRLDV